MDGVQVACPACGGENPAGMRFCGHCGSTLPRLCPGCGQPVPEGMRFCGHCGAQLDAPAASTLTGAAQGSAPSSQTPRARASVSTSPHPPVEERRLVTALFCDLVGFTPLSEQLDPEEVRDIQAAYFSAMSHQIERYEGTVEKYAGDAILALFGAPIAHEDDAERAVLCALGMQATIEPVATRAQARWQIEPQIRVGVNTGEVVSGAWNASGHQQAAVTGDAVNTAARFQAMAEPGEVLVGAETMRLTTRRIRYGERRDLVLKGKEGPIPGYRALAVREDFGERWEEAPRVSPLIGRDRELLLLLDAWMRAQGGEGQLVTLIGEPGVGKSRLVAETVERISASDALRLVHARCLSYGQDISLWLLADLLRSLFGVREQDSGDEVRAKLHAALRSLLARADATSREEARDVLGEVLGLPAGESVVAQAGPQIRRQALLRSLRLLLGALSERSPTVVVLDDLHWIDEASQAVLQEVLADVPGLRLLVLVTQRSGWMPPWSEWGWTERLTLRPLREGDAAVLAGAVLGGMSLSRELEQYLAERTGGNPFFVEEMLRALEESGGLVHRDGAVSLAPGAAARLPSTLTEILLARLDRLESQVKSVVQVGSVIGRSFAVRLLAQVMEREQAALELPLFALQQAEIAFPRQGVDLEYVFKHVTMRDAAYNTLISRRRQELHLKAARAIAALYPADEYVEMIAYHYARTEGHEEAVEWLERAGDRAAAVYSLESALGHYRETLRRLERTDGDPRAMARVEEKLGTTLYTAGRYDAALEVLGGAAERYREQRDLEAAGRVTATMGRAHNRRGTLDEGIALVQPMIELLRWSGPSPALASLYFSLAGQYQRVGQFREMLAAVERAGEIALAVGDGPLLGQAEERRAMALVLLGQAEEALSIFERAIPLIEAGGDLAVLRLAVSNAAFTCERLGRMEDQRRYMEQAVAIAERIGNPDQTGFALANMGSTLITLGDWAGARSHLDRAVALVGEEHPAAASLVFLDLGQLALYEGRWDEAEGLLAQAAQLAERSNREVMEASVTLLGELRVLRGRPEEAVRVLDPVAAEDVQPFVFPPLAWALLELGETERAETVITTAMERTGAERFHRLTALRVLGMVRARQERFDAAQAAFQDALELARSLPYPYEEGRVLHQVGLLEQQRGNPAQQYLEEALDIFRRLGAQKDIERTERDLGSLSPA